MVILDATDHQVIREFYNLNLSKNQITRTRHIWQATKQQMMTGNNIALLEKRRLILTSLQSPIDHVHAIQGKKPKWHEFLYDIIHTRRLHMIKRANYIKERRSTITLELNEGILPVHEYSE
ncbi:unnamed protein product [Adineta ricciae]|uniref:Uncharacterized protein n=1 Tax=Adineta ricciae TaxID=249248 RepID=A0A815VYN5_ADIRI|nr:unnamed protein product [Adineta ricciae]CAF1546085.1 unnamed protein product [Adineta ricciae]